MTINEPTFRCLNWRRGSPTRSTTSSRFELIGGFGDDEGRTGNAALSAVSAGYFAHSADTLQKSRPACAV